MSKAGAAPRSLPLGPGTVSRRIGREPLTLALAGPRALLLQVAHPLVAAGVDQHSDYRRDPFPRAWRTLDWLFKVQFSDPATVARATAILRAAHRGVHGVSDDGVAYRASDPRLLLWVWATIVDSTLLAHERLFGPLPDRTRRRYYEEQKLVGRAAGVPAATIPAELEAFRAYMDATIATELRVTEATRQAAAGASPFFRPPISVLLAPVDAFLAAALLPRGLRRELGLEWGPRQRVAMRAMCSAARIGGRVVPPAVRHAPAELITHRRSPLTVRPPRLLMRVPA